jgi:hypothetical protein
MAKRMTKADISAWIIIICIGLPVLFFIKLIEIVGWGGIAVLGVLVLCGCAFYRSSKKKAQLAEQARQEKEREAEKLRRIQLAQARHDELLAKYGDEKVVQAIIDRSYWQGQTMEQLRDSLGHPEDIDQKVLKTKKFGNTTAWEQTASDFG